MPWYFAYGSNMQSATLRGRRGVGYERAVASRLSGWRLVFDKPSLLGDGNTFANIVPEDGAHVCGVSFLVSDDDMAHIDLTEGVLIGNYRRVPVTVESLEGLLSMEAHTLTSERRHSEPLPSHRYMRLLIEGALEHRLPEPYVDYLRSVKSFDESQQAKEMRASVEAFLRKQP